MKLVLITIFLVIFVGEFQRGESLKCVVCKSTDNENCATNPDKVETTCEAAPPAPTEKPPTSTETPSTEAPKPPTTQAPTTPSSSEPPATTPSSTTQKPSTAPETPKPSPPETPKPSSSAPSTSAPPTTPEKPASSSETTKPASSSEVTQSSSSSEATKPASSSEATQTAPPAPQVQQVNVRSKRQAIHVFAADEGHACYKIIYKENDKEVVERGCVEEKTGCKSLEAGKSDANCKTCSDKDLCNSSSVIVNSLTSMLLLLSVTLYLSR